MRPPDPGQEATSGKYNIQIGSAQGPVIGDNPLVEQHFYAAPGSALDVEQRRNRNRMLTKVHSTWITGFLDPSLHGAAIIALRFHVQSDAVINPWERVVQSPKQSEQSLLSGQQITHIYEAFEVAGEELLILGEPGAGKTMLLLELARALLNRAAQDETYPIPVVFNLSSWSAKRHPLTNWLIEELNSKYQVPRKLGQVWVANRQIALLLDGLDEVREEHRAACIEAINTYRQEHGLVPTVICCRRADYLAQTKRVQLHTAVVVKPLTEAQIEAYLSVGKQLEAVRMVLRSDRGLQEMATTPLMLSILVMTYAGKSLPALQAEVPKTRQQVIADYIARMLQRRQETTRYTPQQTIRWLTWLAQQLVRHNQTEFYLERMQPNWLLNGRSSRLFHSIAFRLIGAVICGLLFSLYQWLGWLVGGLMGWITMGLNTEIKLAEFVEWPWTYARDNWKRTRSTILAFGLGSGLLFGIVGMTYHTFNLKSGLFGLLSGMLCGGSLGMTITGLSSKTLKDHHRTRPNQGIRRSIKSSMIVCSVITLLGGFLGSMLGGLASYFYGVPEKLFLFILSGAIFGLYLGGFLGLIFGLVNGGFTCIRHVILRLLLWYDGSIPWNYARFLDYAAERILLRKIGGGYIFIHRLLLEHFATLDTTPLAPPAVKDSVKIEVCVCGHPYRLGSRFCFYCGKPRGTMHAAQTQDISSQPKNPYKVE